MNEESRQLFDALHQRTLGLHLRWKLYRALHDGSDPSADMRVLSDSSALYLMQQLLWDDCVLRLCRLSESAQVGSYKYLSVMALRELLSSDHGEFTSNELLPRLGRLQTACAPLRVIRNRQIAHSDRATSLGEWNEQSTADDVETVQSALQELRGVMNCVERRFLSRRTSYWDVLVAQTSDGERLLVALQRALGRE